MSDPTEERRPRRAGSFLPTPPEIGDEGPSPDALAQNSATNITSYLIAGPVTFGGLGWLADKALRTHVLTPVGLVVGVALALYIVWFRYGRSSTPTAPSGTTRAGVGSSAAGRDPGQPTERHDDDANDEERV